MCARLDDLGLLFVMHHLHHLGVLKFYLYFFFILGAPIFFDFDKNTLTPPPQGRTSREWAPPPQRSAASPFKRSQPQCVHQGLERGCEGVLGRGTSLSYLLSLALGAGLARGLGFGLTLHCAS